MISVVFSTVNRASILEKTLHSIANVDCSPAEFEVIVVDNGSTDSTPQILRAFSSKIPLVSLHESRPGKNIALNRALDVCQGDIVVFCDDDVIVPSHWLTRFDTIAVTQPQFDVFGGGVYPIWPEVEFAVDPQKLDGFEQHYAVHRIEVCGPYSAGVLPFGPNFAVRRTVFNAVPRFNEAIGPSRDNYIMGSETEFLRRVVAAGHQCFAVSGNDVGHQIRPEQLSLQWLEGRAFRAGRMQGVAARCSDAPRIGGVPRFLWRLWLESLAGRQVRRLYGAKIDFWNAAIRYRRVQGWIFQELMQSEPQRQFSLLLRRVFELR